MAPRDRKTFHQSGGGRAFQSWIGDINRPTYAGIHFCSDETHPGPPFKSGGPMFISKTYYLVGSSAHYSVFLQNSLWYEGKCWVTPYIPSTPAPTDLTGWGAVGWNRTFPTHPIYNLGVSIGELKDFPQMVSQTVGGFRALRGAGSAVASSFKSVKNFLAAGLKVPKGVGDSYLYGAFGVWPMLQDLLFLLKMREKLLRKLAWLAKHNGKSIRRKITLDSGGFNEDIPRYTYPAATIQPAFHSYCYGPKALVYTNIPMTKIFQRKIWYAAKYRLFIPELEGWNRLKGVPKGLSLDLLGLSPDPAIIYQLFPFSWLLNWFVSVGALIANIYQNAKNHVVAEYAYVMCSESFTYRNPGYCDLLYGNMGLVYQVQTYMCESATKFVYKQRKEANPYGFGITFGSLSAYQWSILVALGLSRGGKSSNPRS